MNGLRSELRRDSAWGLVNSLISGFGFGFTSGLIVSKIKTGRSNTETRSSVFKKCKLRVKERGYHDQ
jgi:hypothetical protein